MTSQPVARIWIGVVLVVLLPGISDAQQHIREDSFPGLFSDTPTLGAPFSAVATTTITLNGPDGHQVRYVSRANYFRDPEGRVRVEQALPSAGNNAEDDTLVVLDPDPGDRMVYSLRPDSKRFSYGSLGIAGVLFNGNIFATPLAWNHFYVMKPVAGVTDRESSDGVESLGVQRIAGVIATGRRITNPAPSGLADASIVNERWESADLKIVVLSRQVDPGRGTFEYRLTNIRRVAAAPELFTIPTDYSLHHTSAKDPLMRLESPPGFEADRSAQPR